MKQRAILLDRDGTLVHPRHYPSRPEELLLYDALGEPLRLLQSADFKLVVITNQAGLARGLFSEAALETMHLHLREILAHEGVHLDGIYHCPHHPEGVIPALSIRCNCRKPQPGMLLQAAADLNLDLSRSWFVGDILDDIEAGKRAGCHSILVDIGTESLPTSPVRTPFLVARDTRHALAMIAAAEQLGPVVETDYQPARWSAVSRVGTEV